MRRTLSIIAALGLGLGTIAISTPAHAAASPSPLYVKCESSDISFYGDAGGSIPAANVSAQDFDVLQIRFLAPDGSTNCTGNYDYGDGTNWFTNSGSGFDNTSTPSVALVDGVVSAIGIRMTAQTFLSSSISITYGGGGGGGSSSSDGAGAGPAPVIQQFGLPASGNCDDGASPELNWSGTTSGGWSISWAQWVNNNTGGAVCTRTLMYDTASARWTV